MTYPDSPALVALLTLGLFACGPDKDDSATDANTTANTATTDANTDATTATTDATTDATTASTTDITTSPTTGITTSSTTDITTSPTTEVTTAMTTGETDTGGGACPDPLPEEGTPCDMEGQFCSNGCEDPCQFCNLVKCENGTWQNLEAFPADCLDCESVCEFVVAAACVGGPPDQAICVAGCMDTQAGECGLAFKQMLACIGSQPTFTCDDATRPNVAGCEDNFDALYMCMGG